MQKKEARRIFKEKRNALTAVQRSKMDDMLLIRFQSQELPPPVTVFSYYPLEASQEPNTFLFTDYLSFQFPAVQVCYPRIDKNTGAMNAVAVDDDCIFKPNEYSIPEPLTGDTINPLYIDMVILPLLAFDQRGYRVGYGKGFYDKFLAGCRENCLKVGFSYFEAIEQIDDCNEFDVPLDLCITPQNVYVF